MARRLNGSWRNMATFGQLDIRHPAITTFFGHKFISKTRGTTGPRRRPSPNDWVAIAA